MHDIRVWKRYGRLLLPAFAALAIALMMAAVALSGTVLTRASTSSAGVQGNDISEDPSISADGHYVAFTSRADNLVPGDSNGKTDVFVKDMITHQITMVSTDSSGTQYGNDKSEDTAISADGRYVAFESSASNLVYGDTNGDADIFLKDTWTGQTSRVSTSSTGEQANGDSGNYSVNAIAISGDGRYVAFSSRASNLVPDDTNGKSDIFVKDTVTGHTSRVSTDSAGVQGNRESYHAAITPDGRYVAFFSYASNLVPGDTNWAYDAFVKDTQTGQTTRVSTDSSGGQGNDNSGLYSGMNPTISADGRYVAFHSYATNLVPGDTNAATDVFLKDTLTGQTTMISTSSSGDVGNRYSWQPTITADGRYVMFRSDATNLVPGDTNNYSDVFIKDTLTDETIRVSVNEADVEGNHSSDEAAIAAYGLDYAFRSYASNLVTGDTNETADIFVKGEPCTPAPERPHLYLSHESYWATFADYLVRELSVDLHVSNASAFTAYEVQITGSTNTGGVVLLTETPAMVGDIAAGADGVTTVRYFVPDGVINFTADVTGSALDECGAEYSYPPE
jgi:archaellum component FlaF (FlaF/FlaG flagellin family)